MNDERRYPYFIVHRSSFIVSLILLCSIADAHPGVGIVMDSRGNVFYSDLKHVWRIAPDGTKTIAVRNVHTHELAIDAEDNLYGEHLWYEGEATDTWGHRVWRLSRDGRLVDIIPAREGFLTNYSFVRDRAGNMYWVERGDQTVLKKRAPDGRINVVLTARFRDVRWMTAAADGTIYLVDFHDLCRVTPDGKMVTLVRNLANRRWSLVPIGARHWLMGLWTDSRRNVYVAAYGSREVKKVLPDGRVSVVARTDLPWSPTGGMFALNGDLWLLEYSATNQARARRISPNGQSRVY